MAYERTVWVDNSAPALEAVHLNNIESGILDVDGRLTTAEGTISSHTTSINTNTTNISTNSGNISDIQADLTDVMIVREGTFTGSWYPSLISTFGIADWADYNWTIDIIVPSRTTQNGDILIQEAYVSGSAITLISTYAGADLSAKYRLIGIKKSVSNYVTVNQA